MGAGLAILALVALGLAAASAGRSSARRGGVTAQTRARVRETLATPDARAATIPVEPAPARVDPDRRAGAPLPSTEPGSDLSTYGRIRREEREAAARARGGSSSGSGTQSAWSRSRGEAAGGYTAEDRARARGRAELEASAATGAPSGSSTSWARAREPAPSSSTAGAADMGFAPDAAGRSPHEPGYIDPASSSSTAGLVIEPPDTAPEGEGAPEGAGEAIPEEARTLAASTAAAIRNRSSGWRNRLRAFQRAAGIAPDGRYGGLTHNALRYYGIRNPPPATSPPRPSSPLANYVDRVIAPPGGA